MKSCYDFIMKDFLQNVSPTFKPWLILGDGDSLSRHEGMTDLWKFNTLALDEASAQVPSDFAYISHIQVLLAHGEAIEARTGAFLMPDRLPLYTSGDEIRPLAEWVREVPLLARMSEAGRLYYLREKAFAFRGEVTDVSPAHHATGVAPIYLLADAGAKTMRTLGLPNRCQVLSSSVDGEVSDAAIAIKSSRHQYPDLLSETIVKYHLSFSPLDVPTPIRVFVGSTEKELIPAKVLEYSLKRHATASVEVVPVYQAYPNIPVPVDPGKRARTSFSFQRFILPQLCNYQGRAFYMDSDMLAFADIAEVWDLDMGNHQLVTMRSGNANYSLFLLDCASVDWNIQKIVRDLDNDVLTYDRLVFQFCLAERVSEGYDNHWNDLDVYKPNVTKLIHYTDVTRQPWRFTTDHPIGHIWFAALKEAYQSGYISRELVAEHVAKGHVIQKCLDVLTEVSPVQV